MFSQFFPPSISAFTFFKIVYILKSGKVLPVYNKTFHGHLDQGWAIKYLCLMWRVEPSGL